MNYLIILNDAPYCTERSYNGLRLAMSLMSQETDAAVTVFLIGDAVTCARAGLQAPDDCDYSIERMLTPIAGRGEVLLCGTCMDARGLRGEELCEGARRSSMGELTEKTAEAHKVLVF
jgi:uncharacterized protein involved in oxidation of intracellular sulfur